MFRYTISGVVDRPSSHHPGQRVQEQFQCQSATKDRRIIRRDLRKWFGTPLIIRSLKIKGAQS